MNKAEKIMNELKELFKDEDYKRAWKDNIAVSFQDCYANAEDKTDIHKISNESAEHFLWLITK